MSKNMVRASHIMVACQLLVLAGTHAASVLVARAVPISQFALEAQVDLATLRAGAGSLSNESDWGWLGLDEWPTAGWLEMRCFGGKANGT
jgi:hypothetical protein